MVNICSRVMEDPLHILRATFFTVTYIHGEKNLYMDIYSAVVLTV
jgi:hypothetical protein